jgi:hypothetical protein
MKKLEIGQTIQILANVGVIAGIAFLGLELRQNNELMAAQARFNRLSIITDAFDTQAVEPCIADILVKDRSDERLSPTEELRVQSYCVSFPES